MDKECGRRTIAKIQINMKEGTKMIKNMDMENFNGAQEANIKVTMLMIKKWDTEKCIGKMEPFIEDFGMRVNKMVLV
jgi:hypothetical protein